MRAYACLKKCACLRSGMASMCVFEVDDISQSCFCGSRNHQQLTSTPQGCSNHLACNVKRDACGTRCSGGTKQNCIQLMRHRGPSDDCNHLWWVHPLAGSPLFMPPEKVWLIATAADAAIRFEFQCIGWHHERLLTSRTFAHVQGDHCGLLGKVMDWPGTGCSP